MGARATALLLAGLIAGLAGFVDAIGYSQLRELFVSFMSGNSTIFGLSFGRADMHEAARSGLLITLFVAGSAGGTMLAVAAGAWHLPVVLVAIGALLGAAAAWPGGGLPLPALVLLVLGMGALNAAMNNAGGFGLGLTYVTGSLAKFGRGIGLALLGQSGGNAWLAQGVPWLGLVGGAALGALAFGRLERQALGIGGGLALLLAGLAMLIPAGWRDKAT